MSRNVKQNRVVTPVKCDSLQGPVLLLSDLNECPNITSPDCKFNWSRTKDFRQNFKINSKNDCI